MKEKKETNDHYMAVDTETGAEWTTDAAALLSDIKFLMKEYYVATFDGEGTELKLSFKNGQSFKISVEETK